MYVQESYYFPIKSAAGNTADYMEIASHGPKHDREFVIVDAYGNFLSQRKFPKLCLIRTTILMNLLFVEIPGHKEEFSVPLWSIQDGGQWKVIRVWDDVCLGLDMGGQIAEALSNFVGIPCRLIHYSPLHLRLRESSTLGIRISVSFADAYPILLITQASLDDLNSRLATPIPMRNFRPNFVIGGVKKAYAEDTWKMVRIGKLFRRGMYLRGATQSSRCVITTTDQDTGAREEGGEPLRTLATYRRGDGGKVYFGKNAVNIGVGVVRKGDRVIAVSSPFGVCLLTIWMIVERISEKVARYVQKIKQKKPRDRDPLPE